MSLPHRPAAWKDAPVSAVPQQQWGRSPGSLREVRRQWGRELVSFPIRSVVPQPLSVAILRDT